MNVSWNGGPVRFYDAADLPGPGAAAPPAGETGDGREFTLARHLGGEGCTPGSWFLYDEQATGELEPADRWEVVRVREIPSEETRA